MKRSEMIEHIRWLAQDIDHGYTSTTVAENILKKIEDLGMLPPLNTCKVIPDEHKGGFKHSPSKREWDEE